MVRRNITCQCRLAVQTASSVRRYVQSDRRTRSWVTVAFLTVSLLVCLPLPGVVSAGCVFTPIPNLPDHAAVRGFNDAGTVVGQYSSEGRAHGFLLSGATVTPVDYPGARFTSPADINNHGHVVGTWDAGAFLTQDLVNFTPLDFPEGAFISPSGINDHGHIIGYYTAPGSTDGKIHGFLYVGGTWTTIDYPGSRSTQPRRINNDGAIVGSYQAQDFRTYAFVRDRLGTWTTINIPEGAFAFATGIDDSGRIVGGFFPNDNAFGHAFLKAGTTLATIDYPGQRFTDFIDINNAGEILGSFYATDFIHVTGHYIARGCLSPTVIVTSNATTFHPAESLAIDVTVANPGEPVAVDVYFGVALPSAAGPGLGCPGGDAVAFITAGSAQITCSIGAPAELPGVRQQRDSIDHAVRLLPEVHVGDGRTGWVLHVLPRVDDCGGVRRWPDRPI